MPLAQPNGLGITSGALFDADDNAVIPATILVVDSEEINRRLLKAIFKTTPYTILEARKASEATALLNGENRSGDSGLDASRDERPGAVPLDESASDDATDPGPDDHQHPGRGE